MNLREAVLCQRLRMRSRELGELHPATEEDVRAVEEQLGFRLPPMLRAVYLHVDNGLGLLGLHSLPRSQEGPSRDPWILGRQLGARHTPLESRSDAPATPDSADTTGAADNPAPRATLVEALRQHPGAYCSWGEDGFPDDLPDHWEYIASASDLWVLLDGDTGYLYYQVAGYNPKTGEDWSQISYCAPSVEDWLERELDASRAVWFRYYPHRKLADVLRDGAHGGVQIEELPPDDVSPAAGAARADLRWRRARGETRRLRVENLSDEGPDPVEQVALSGIHYANPNALQMRHIGWKLEQARHQALRQLYRLMDIIESAAATSDTSDNTTREDWSEAVAPEALGALIEADAQLAPITKQIPRGISPLYRLAGLR